MSTPRGRQAGDVSAFHPVGEADHRVGGGRRAIGAPPQRHPFQVAGDRLQRPTRFAHCVQGNSCDERFVERIGVPKRC